MLHWIVMFPKTSDSTPSDKTGVEPGLYTLQVFGYTADGTEYAGTSYIFEVRRSHFEPPPAQVGDARREVPERRYSIAADYPESYANITEEADYFVAYGPCIHDAEDARMNTSTRSFPADSVYSNLALEFWSAVFPPLDPETYELTAADSQLHPLTYPVTNLVVDP